MNRSRGRRWLAGFTLLEVMIAVAIFFAAMLSILTLMTQGLRAAHSLRNDSPSPGFIASEMSLTNRLEEGMESGDFGVGFRGYSWTRNVTLVGSNGFFQADIAVLHDGRLDSSMSVYFYKPESATPLGGARPSPGGARR